MIPSLSQGMFVRESQLYPEREPNPNLEADMNALNDDVTNAESIFNPLQNPSQSTNDTCEDCRERESGPVCRASVLTATRSSGCDRW